MGSSYCSRAALSVSSWATERIARLRHVSRVSVAPAFIIFWLTLSAGAFAQDSVPVVEEIRLAAPLSGDTFGPGERVWTSVTFSESVVITGNPRLVLQIGDQSRSADLAVVSGRRAWFSYYVKASDRDDDGISVRANAVLLNRGSIRDLGGNNDADLTHEAVPDDPGRKVDGRLNAIPTITAVRRAWRPLVGDTFGRGESLIVRVTFSEPVAVTGAPQLSLQVGNAIREADLHRRGGSSFSDFEFEYLVQTSDVDADGFSVPADALTLNGGSIWDADGNGADLTHDALPADPQYKVNGTSGSPSVRDLIFLRSPASEGTYVAGETIYPIVRFSRPVYVTGSPQLTLQVGRRRGGRSIFRRDGPPNYCRR